MVNGKPSTLKKTNMKNNNKTKLMRATRIAMTLLLLLMTSTTAWTQTSPTISVEACEGKHGSLYVKG